MNSWFSCIGLYAELLLGTVRILGFIGLKADWRICKSKIFIYTEGISKC